MSDILKRLRNPPFGTETSECKLMFAAADEINKQRALIETLTAALVECEDYFDNRADADCDQDGFIPNEEMKRLQGVREALAAAKEITQ